MGMVARIARTCAAWADHHDPDAWRAYQGVARLILAEMREPTDAMVKEMDELEVSEVGWRVAIDAALAEPDQTKPE